MKFKKIYYGYPDDWSDLDWDEYISAQKTFDKLENLFIDWLICKLTRFIGS